MNEPQAEQPPQAPQPTAKSGWWAGLQPRDKKLLLRVAALALVGVVLMTAFGRAPAQQAQPATAQPLTATETPAGGDQLEEKLAQLLSSVKGAGRVQVAITYQGSQSALYVFDSSEALDAEGSESSRQLSVADGQPVLIGTSAAEIRGVAITAPGAGDPLVRERLFKAASGLLGVGAERIAIVEAEGGNTDVIP